MHATYSPEDNKLRLYAETRLDADTYQRVRAAGFIWAPKQGLFVAPAWSPSREDLLLELCEGEIGDEDTSLVDRAEQRADRFGDYSDSRREDAEQARARVAAITDNIPFGQPILIGHHSERHARRDAARIENGMRRAVQMWKTSEYWTRRAAGALAHAKYKERPDVRARRIKGIEADRRKAERNKAEAEKAIRIWENLHDDQTATARTKKDGTPTTFAERARFVAGHSNTTGMNVYFGLDKGTMTPEEAQARVLAAHRASLAAIARWLEHYDNRLAYERAMLEEAGGLVAEREEIAVGGRVLVRGEWVVVLKVNRKDGRAVSFRTARRYGAIVSAEEVQGYEAPSAEQAQATAQAMKRPPLCNYPGQGFAHCTTEQWEKIPKDHRSQSRRVEETAETGAHCVRAALGVWMRDCIPADALRKDASPFHHYYPVYVTDAKRKDPPTKQLQARPEPDLSPRSDLAALEERAARRRASEPTEQDQAFNRLREQAKTPARVVVVPQLFPTPPELARRMASEAGLLAGRRVLEPSAGTGNLVRAIFGNATGADCVRVVAVEQAAALVAALEEQRSRTVYANGENFAIVEGDFLAQNGNLGKFDAVLMNPPFENGADIRHIRHALTFLKPGGRLVAICANGPRQQEQLKPLASSWVELPADTFREQGTSVRTALLTIEAPR